MKLNKTNLILWSLVIFSVFILLFSLIFSDKNTSRKGVKTALLNNKYKDSLNEISISDNKDCVELKKINDMWFVINNNNKLPADSVKTEKFIGELLTLRNIYKISTSKNLNQFGLNSESSCIITYKTNENETKLYFGNHDFSQSFRFFKTEKNLNIYEIDTKLDVYLNSSVQNWTEPYLISKVINKDFSSDNVMRVFIQSDSGSKVYSDSNSEYVQKLSELRHTGFITNESKNKTATVKIELGNKESLLIEIFSTEEDSEFNCYVSYYNSDNNLYLKTGQKISSWTYNKLVLL